MSSKSAALVISPTTSSASPVSPAPVFRLARGPTNQQHGTSSSNANDDGNTGGGREEIFQRIMRKLQHQANYSDSGALTLTQQALGVASPVAAVAPAEADDKAADDDKGNATGSGQATALQPGVRVQRKDQETGSSSPSSRGAAVSRGSAKGAAKELEDDEERKFGEQPCPPTLRLVVDYVRSTVEEKLQLAHIGSLWETMKFVFESRTMLDKLLKEITQHSHFKDMSSPTTGQGGKGLPNHRGVGGGSSSSKAQELYQELRKIPVVLPQAQYVEDTASGKYHAELRSMDSQQQPYVGSGQMGGGGSPATNVPPSYTNAEVMMNHNAGRNGGLNAKHLSPQPPHGGIGGATSSGTYARYGGGGLVQSHPEHFANTAAAAKDRRDHELLMKHLRRKTQVEERGMQTEENNLNIILKEQYVALGKHCADVEVELEQKKGVIRDLNETLIKTTRQLEQKTRVVQYLRSTLFKETCILRQQLAAAQQRQLIMQQQQALLSQQMLSQVSNIGSGAMSGSIMVNNSGQGGAERTSAAAVWASTSQTQLDDFDVSAVSSVIDLALLGVEKNRSLNRTPQDIMRISAATGGLISSPGTGGGTADDPLLLPNAESQVTKLREELQLRTFKWKRELAAMRSKFALVVTEKNKQIKSIQLASDVKNLRSILISQVASVREDYGQLRKFIRETISSMRNHLLTGLAEAEYSIRLIADAIDVSSEREKVVSVQHELLVACKQLFLPMLNYDYAIGSHPWLQKHRMTDPLLHALQTKFTPEVIGNIAGDLDAMHYVYQMLQRFVLKSFAVPQVAHAQPGQVLVRLIGSLISDVTCTPDLTMQLRTCLQIEQELARRLARINFKLKVTTWKQRTAQECSVKALKEMGLDSQTAGATTQRAVNRLGMRTTMLMAVKNDVVRQRMSNAKEVHRIWRESSMDPFRGRRPPAIREPIVHSMSSSPLSPTTGTGVGGAGGRGGQRSVSIVAGGGVGGGTKASAPIAAPSTTTAVSPFDHALGTSPARR